MELDRADLTLLDALQRDGRATIQSLSEAIHLSARATLNRVRSWNSRTWPVVLRATTTFSRWSPSTSSTTCAELSWAASPSTVTLLEEAMLRLSSLPSEELGATAT